MTTSGTTSFNLDIDELFQEAYERIGIDGSRSGYHLRSARRSLNLLLSECDNRGVHLWKVKLATVPLVLGQAEYNYAADTSNYPNDINDVLEAYVRNNTVPASPVDISLTKIDRSAYAALPNKLSQGTPSQYYVQRTYTNTPDVVYRFLPALTSGMAYYLSIKHAPQRTQELRLFYEDDLQRALVEDGQRTSLFISPKTYFGDGL